jgi:hypothetical protein
MRLSRDLLRNTGWERNSIDSSVINDEYFSNFNMILKIFIDKKAFIKACRWAPPLLSIED